ncbi:MAG: hypothetical protein U0441_17830 [Polyangiaceae bacterium]
MLIASPFVAACSQDHSLLAPSTTSSGGSGAGTGGDTTGTTTGTGGAGGDTSTTSSGTGGAEPAGPTKLTIVNGVGDYDAIRVCFQPYPSGPSVTPWPAQASGVAFSKAVVVDPMTIAPIGDVQPYVLAGDLNSIAGKSCDDAIALAASGSGSGGAAGSGGAGGATGAPPPIVASPMPVIPASVFTAEKSLLLVFYGCLGGPGHDDPSAQIGCGFAYTPQTPTASLTLVAMSRKTTPKAIALEVVHASAAMQPSDIRFGPGFDMAQDVPFVSNLALGGLAPKPPFFGMARADFGSLTTASIKVYQPNTVSPLSAHLLPDVFGKSGVKDADFADGSAYTFVAVGGYPGVPSQAFWKGFTFTLVKSDP